MTRLSWFYRFGLAALAVALVSLTVNAQPRGGRGGRPGGFGGGFGGGASGLLAMPEVQKELDLTQDQLTKLQEARGKLMESMRSEGGPRPERGSFRDMSEEERQKFMADMQKRAQEMEKKADAMVKEILLPNQYERLEQLTLQRQGVRALSDPKVIEALKITPEQQAELTKISEEVRNQMMELFRGGGRDASEEQRAQNREKMETLRSDMEKKAMGVLSAEQKQELGKLMGKPFEFPERGRGPGGDRGGRGDRGGNRGGNRG